ncbi:conjugative transposon protein TraM [Flagellimonas sp.]|uniref:conjugative transposon protein TraM n=1 Tax=Flagellimonas sp. TaxID=2058762 RepID=UPI003AB22D3A
MKQQKNKIVFVLVMVCVVLFITVYTILNFGKDKKEDLEPNRIPMPDLEENQMDYGTKLEAIEAIKEEREIAAPQVYPDHMVDDKGYFNPDYMEYEKQRIIDSVYQSPTFESSPVSPIGKTMEPEPNGMGQDSDTVERKKTVESLSMQDRSISHQLFFTADPGMTQEVMSDDKELAIMAYVDGDQIIRDGHRLELRLGQDIQLGGLKIEANTRIYGFVKIRPNRVMVDLAAFGSNGILWKAHDLQDGQEGIYVENHIKGEVVERGLDETLREVNVPGLPQIGGLKRIFQRHNRAIKVGITDKYQLVLKPEL